MILAVVGIISPPMFLRGLTNSENNCFYVVEKIGLGIEQPDNISRIIIEKED